MNEETREQLKTHYTDKEVMHEVIAQRLKEVKDYTGEFIEIFRYDKDAKIKMPENIITLKFRHIVLDDSTLVSIYELFGVVGLSCEFQPQRD